MYKFTTFNSDAFYRALEEKDYSRLITCIISAVRNNPEFRNATGQKSSESTIALNLLRENVPEIFETYKQQEGERIYDETEYKTWDKEYFIRQTFLLGENFCVKRYKHVKAIGCWISRGVVPNFQEPQEQCQAELQHQTIKENVYKAPQKTNPLLVLGVVALAIIVLVVMVAVIQ